VALAITAAAFGLTGYVLVNGGLTNNYVPAYAEFSNCGQGLRVRGDVKLRGVLVGLIEDIKSVPGENCRVTLGIFEDSQEQIPANVGAQIRAKTIFGEKWVELLYPQRPDQARLASDDVIPPNRTIDPLEVETILNTALPLLESIDPENLAASLEALSTGFVGHEEAAIRSMTAGIRALEPLNDNEALLNEGITQLADSSEVFQDVDEELLQALDKLDTVQRFTIDKQELIASNFEKVPALLDELTFLFDSRFNDFTKLVDKGATVIGVLAARADDLDRLLTALPKFTSGWIRNLNHNCRYRQETDEPGKQTGDEVPGRCWRVHNIISESQGPYNNQNKPRPGGNESRSSSSETASNSELRHAGLSDTSSDIGRVLFTPAAKGSKR
jgi:virulence factor Mce-like protein